MWLEIWEEVKVLGNFVVFMAWGWFIWFTYSVVIGSRRKARAQVKKLREGGFCVDHMLKGNIYVLFDHTNKKIAFVFRDSSFVYDYGDVKSVTRYWMDFPGVKLRNTLVFALQGKKIRCRNLSARQAEYWHPRLAELIAA
jgi:hypothetical protein